MNCNVVQRRLLALEDPHRPSAELRGHLAHCPACRAWQRQLVELEERVPLLDVPPSDAKAGLIERVLAGAVELKQEKPAPRLTLPLRTAGERRDIARRKVALATALVVSLAAAVLVMGVANWPSPTAPSRGPAPAAAGDPLLRKLLRHDLILARWTPAQDNRLKTLADLADDLQGETRALAVAEGDGDLQTLARCYDRVLHEGIESVGGGAPAKEREDIAAHLWAARAELERLAGTAGGDRGHQLQRMAEAAAAASRALGREHAGARVPAGRSGLSFAAPHLAGRGALLASVPTALLAVLAEAQLPPAEPDLSAQARRFGRNRDLIEQLVAGGVRLAREKNPLQRADCCKDLVQSLATEIRKAAGQQEDARVGDLADHLGALLREGVAANLVDARAQKAGSADEERWKKVKNDTDGFMTSLEKDFQGTDAMKGAFRAWKEKVQPLPAP